MRRANAALRAALQAPGGAASGAAMWVAGAALSLLLLTSALGVAAAAGRTVQVEVVGAEADAVTATADLEDGTWVIDPPSGFVRLTSEETVVVAQTMRLGEAEGEQRAELSGRVKIARPDLYATSETLRVDMEAQRYTFSGGARLYRWPSGRELFPDRLTTNGRAANGRPEGADAENTGTAPPAGLWGEWVDGRVSDPLVIEGDRLAFDEASGRIDGSGQIYVKDDSVEAWSDAFTYDPETERAVLTGAVRAVLEGQTIEQSPRLVVDLADDRATIAGPWKATIQVDGGE